MVKSARIMLAIIAPLVLLAVLLAVVSAQGTFPTTPILDNFDRANGGPPLSESWLSFETGSELVVSGTYAVAEAITNNTYYATFNASHGPDSEAYITIITLPTGSVFLGIRYYSISGMGYEVKFDVWGQAFLWNPNGELLSSTSVTITNGDSIGIRAYGTEIIVFHKTAVGEWTPVITATDIYYEGAGRPYVAMEDENQTGALDNFGAGTIEAEQTPNIIGYNSVATITLSSGEIVAVNYSYTFGDMGVIAVVLLLVVLTGVQFVYGVTVKVWEWRQRR